jgi:hypothetical protein
MWELLVSCIALAVIAALVYWGPEWFASRHSLIEVEGVEYQITREDDLLVSVRFTLNHIEHCYYRGFDDSTLRDLWIKGFGKKEADNIKKFYGGSPNLQTQTFPKLPKGKALVIEGAQRSGKTTMAKRVAFHAGEAYYEIHENDLLKPFHTEAMAAAGVWILDADFLSNKGLAAIKAIIGSEKIRSEVRGQDPTLIPEPSIILCVNDATRFHGSRNFEIFKL